MPDSLTSKSAFLQGRNARTTSIGAQVEYLADANYRRTTNIGVGVEYKGATNQRRTTFIGIQVEYKPLSVSSQDAYLAGTATSNHAQAGYLAGADNALSDTPAFLQGQDNALSDTPAYTEGIGPEALGSQNVFLSGEVSTFSSTQAFLSAASSRPAISWAELEVPPPPPQATGSQAAYTHGQADASAGQGAYLQGTDSALSSQDAYTAGNQSDLDSQAAYLAGILQATSSAPAYAEGYSPSGPASTSQDAFLQGALGASGSTGAYLNGKKGTFPVTIGAGNIVNYGAALLTTSRGEKYAVFSNSSNFDLRIYKYIDGAPLLVSSVTTDTIGNLAQYRAAAIDGNDKIHVICHGGRPDEARDLSYRVYDTATDTWEGSWEQAATLQGSLFDNWGIKIAIDSNSKPHVAYIDISGGFYQLYYIEKTGANWTSPLLLSGNAAKSYALEAISMKSGDDIEVWYFNDTDNTMCYITKASGSWGAEQTYSGASIENRSGLHHTIDGSGNIYRYSAQDMGTYANIFENNANTNIQHNDSGVYFSATWLANFPNYKILVYRHEDTAIWAAIYAGGAWWTKRISSNNAVGIFTEWAYNFENENTVAGFIYVVSNTVYYDELLPSVFSHQPAYLQGHEPKGAQGAYLRGSTDISSSAHAYMFCGTQEQSSQPAFTEGAAVQSSTPAYLEGTQFISYVPAYLVGSVNASQPGYINAIGILTASKPAYLFATDQLEGSSPAYASGHIAARSSMRAFCQTSTASTSWRLTAFLQGLQVNRQPAYLEGSLVTRSYIRVRNGEQVFTFKVLTEGYSDGELAPSIAAVRTISGGLDVSVGGKYRSWRPTLRCNYTDMTNLETLYASVEPWVYEDHFGMQHNVVAVGELRKSLIGSVIEGTNSLFLVRVTFVEVL